MYPVGVKSPRQAPQEAGLGDFRGWGWLLCAHGSELHARPGAHDSQRWFNMTNKNKMRKRMICFSLDGTMYQDGDEEANDEGLRRFARPCAAHDMVIEKMPQMEEEDNPWEALNSSLRKQGFREVSLTRHGGSVALPDPTSVADTLRDVVFKHGEREKVIQEMSLELQRLNNVSGHRDSVLNESFRREKSDLSRRSAGAEARVAVLEEEKERLQNQLANLIRRSKTETASLASQLKQSEHRVKAKEAEVQKLMDKLQDEAEKERLCQQRERAVLAKFQQKHTLRGGSTADESRAAESLVAHFSKAQRRSEAEMDDLRAQVSRLGDDLREKENTILQHRLGPDWTPDFDQDVKNTATSDDELRNLRARLAESERSVSVLKQRERRAQDRCANMEEQCIEVQTKADETQVKHTWSQPTVWPMKAFVLMYARYEPSEPRNSEPFPPYPAETVSAYFVCKLNTRAAGDSSFFFFAHEDKSAEPPFGTGHGSASFLNSSGCS